MRPQDPSDQTGPHAGRSAVILVGDRDDDSRAILRKVLEHLGYDVHVATDGDALLREVREGEVALVIAELYLPCESGQCAVRCLKADAALRHVPVIVLTSQIFPADVEWARSAGAEHFLRKPIDFRELFAAVRDVLGAPAPTPPAALPTIERPATQPEARA